MERRDRQQVSFNGSAHMRNDLPVVNHEFLHGNQCFITNVWIFVAKELHDQLLSAKVLNETKKKREKVRMIVLKKALFSIL